MGVTFPVTLLHLVTDRREALISFCFTVKLRRQEERRGLTCGPTSSQQCPIHSLWGISGGWEAREQSQGQSTFLMAPSVILSINSLLPDRSHPSIRKEFGNLSSASWCSKGPQTSPCHTVCGHLLDSAAYQSELSGANGHHCLIHTYYWSGIGHHLT